MDKSFKDKYTTADLIAEDVTPGKIELTKMIISNDALAIGEMLEQMTRELSFRFGRIK